MSDKRLTILVEPALLARFKARVALQGLTMSDVIRQLIDNWLRMVDNVEQQD